MEPSAKEHVSETTHLRPLERRILAMHADGQSLEEIAGRIRKSPEQVERIIGWTDIPRSKRAPKYARALETRVLALRAEGMDHADIASRFRRSPENIRLIEALAHYRQAISLMRGAD